MTRTDDERLFSWYLGLIMSGATPEEAAEIIEKIRANEAQVNAVGGG